ncbi:MAG: MBL fold metallo-hydrolase [Spirochaetales bacterium]|jgi:phosphoribosyl 1,2-cyclic phosphodiesterase|nr:MBL fold metallo-hydrolase [Spirochaetales bacterium]
MKNRITFRFWGVRGSIPCPGPDTVRVGGNTACIELRFGEENRLVIIDAGSGLRALGDFIMRNDLPKGPVNTDILISHTHWDHIMGFPFFAPIYLKSTNLRIYGPVSYEEERLEEVIGGQLRYRYFPVRQDELSAHIEYHELKEASFELGDGIFVTTKYLNHPILCLGYRLEYKGRVFCTAYDTEPFRNVFPTDPSDPGYDESAAREGALAAEEENEKLVRFLQDADVLVYDTQYTREEYEASKTGWGHSTFEYAMQTADRAGVKKLYFFHHDPLRTDSQLEALAQKYCCGDGAETFSKINIAREGVMFEV